MSAKVDTKAFKAAMAKLADVADRNVLEAALMAGGLVLEGHAKANIVEYDFIDTGLTLNSTQARPADGTADPEVHIGPSTDYAIFGELGIGQPKKPFMADSVEEGADDAVAAVQDALRRKITEAAR